MVVYKQVRRSLWVVEFVEVFEGGVFDVVEDGGTEPLRFDCEGQEAKDGEAKTGVFLVLCFLLYGVVDLEDHALFIVVWDYLLCLFVQLQPCFLLDGQSDLQVILCHFDINIFVFDQLMNKDFEAILLFLFGFFNCFVVDLNEFTDG